jgi:hypothetical protein
MNKMKYIVPVVCCYCKQQFDTKGGFTDPDVVTHGVCPECGEREKIKLVEKYRCP